MGLALVLNRVKKPLRGHDIDLSELRRLFSQLRDLILGMLYHDMGCDWVNIVQHVSAAHVHAFHQSLSYALIVVLVDVDVAGLEVEPGFVVAGD